MDSNIEIGIVDARNIIREVKNLYNYDFTDYSLTSFKRRLAYCIESNNLKDSDKLIAKLKTDKDFFEVFLNDLRIASTEMFRDPSLWRILLTDLLPKIASNNSTPKIWMPDNVSGDELYSLMIILKENNLIDKIEVIAHSFSQSNLNSIQTGFFDQKKIQLSNDNFKRLNCNHNFTDFYQIKNNIPYRDTSLIKNVKFIKQNSIFDDAPDEIDLVLYRNQMIYFNQPLQDKTLQVLHNATKSKGYLIIGIKEILPSHFKDYIIFNDSESIYKRRK